MIGRTEHFDTGFAILEQTIHCRHKNIKEEDGSLFYGQYMGYVYSPDGTTKWCIVVWKNNIRPTFEKAEDIEIEKFMWVSATLL